MSENTMGYYPTSNTSFTSKKHSHRKSAWEDETNPAIKIYISYSKNDQLAEEEFEKHLIQLQRDGLIEHWNNQKVAPGAVKDEVVKKRLSAAQVIIFLVSPELLASPEHYDKEILPAIEHLESGKIQHIIPILLQHCDWPHTPFSRLQSLPRNGQPIKSSKDPDRAWNEIVKELRSLCEGLSSNNIDINGSISPASRPDINRASPPTITGIQKPENADIPAITLTPVTRSMPSEIQSRRYKHVHTIDENTTPIWSLAFSPDGKYLASNRGNGGIKMWDMLTKTFINYSMKNYVDVTSAIAFSPDGKYLASGSDDGSIKLWNCETQKIEKALQGHAEWVTCILFSADGHYLVSGGDDGSIKVWNVPRMSRRHHLQEQGAISRIAFAPNNQLLASSSYNQAVKLRNISADPLQTFKELPSKASSLAFSPNGEHLAIGNENGSIEIWETKHWKIVQTLTKYTERIRSLAFHPDGTLLASGGEDKSIHLWDVSTGIEIQTLTKHTDQIENIVFSPDGQFIASGGRDMNIQLWESL